MSYSYVVYTADKEVLKGTLDVHSESLAEETLENYGYRILSLQEIKKRSLLEEQFPSLFGIKEQDVVDFSEQLAIMVGAGIALPSALQQIEEQTESAAFRRVIYGLGRELRAGCPFSDALSRYPKVFPDVFCRIVRAGEQSGNLEEALMQAVNYMQRGTAIMKEVKRVLVYPCFIVILAIIVVGLMVTVAMPPLMGLFTDLDADLPLPTKMLMAFTDFATAFKFHILGATTVLVGMAYWYFKTPSGRLLVDSILLKIPGMRGIIIQTNMALFSRTMSVLLNSGVALPQIMEVTQQTTSNRIIRRAIRDVQEGIYEGQGLAKPMLRNRVFPSLLVRMVSAGELSGTLDSNLAKLANYYEDEANKKIDTFVSLLEPAITVALGLGVGFIAISLIMPMYSMMGSM
ncbi:MAG: type II secretion system F family protein [Chloroflexi bacterium]|jgi:type IV pilus assembly protein PilC|nr:type II secretion system F family protein [Chloroflexota bacterium]